MSTPKAPPTEWMVKAADELAEIADETLSSEGSPEAYEREMATLRERMLSYLSAHAPAPEEREPGFIGRLKPCYHCKAGETCYCHEHPAPASPTVADHEFKPHVSRELASVCFICHQDVDCHPASASEPCDCGCHSYQYKRKQRCSCCGRSDAD